MQFTVRRAHVIGSFESAGGIISPSTGVNFARNFNGSSDLINCGHNNSFLSPAAITMAAWINPSSLTPAYSAVGSRADANIDYYQILVKSTGKAAYYVFAGASNVDIDPGAASINTSTWTHIAFSYDSVNGLQTYVNGISDGTQAATGTLSSTFTTQDLTFGTDTNTAGRSFAGAMADMAIWNTNLTPTQIASLAALNRSNTIGANANLVCYLPILGQSPEPDRSSSGNNGVLTGTTIVAGPPGLPLIS